LPFRIGAWLREYGIPLHAWNESFFKLCVFECGSYLRTDNCSLSRQRFDFARVLVSTSSFEVINMSEQISIDGGLVGIKIVEEWGFNLGEDVCLSDEDEKSFASSPETEKFHDDIDTNNNVDVLVDKMAKEFAEVEDENENVKGTSNGAVNLETTTSVEKHDPIVLSSAGPDSPKLASQVVAASSSTGKLVPNAESPLSFNEINPLGSPKGDALPKI
jgi:hypothetical protein